MKSPAYFGAAQGTTSLESGSVRARLTVFPALGPLACAAGASSV
ncbi:MAG TPA: hypothetical protein VH021_14050 [Trebonia sp.]|nr:hypothetical protein [Trebonia sp.]